MPYVEGTLVQEKECWICWKTIPNMLIKKNLNKFFQLKQQTKMINSQGYDITKYHLIIVERKIDIIHYTVHQTKSM